LQDGGAIYTAGNNVTIDNCIFVRNAAVNDGGAIHVKRSGSNTKIVNSVFDDNFAFREQGFVLIRIILKLKIVTLMIIL